MRKTLGTTLAMAIAAAFMTAALGAQGTATKQAPPPPTPAKADAKAAPAKSSLYDRLGGKTAITAVVDEFVARVGADAKINKFFTATVADKARLAAFKGKLVDQICEAAGGPCKYTGKDMKAAHANMGISGADFDALVADLVGALDKFKVAEADQKSLLGVLGPMKADIATKK